MQLKRWIWLLLLCAMLAGCSKKEEEPERTALEYTVVTAENLPEELAQLIENQKENECRLTYEADGYLYIVRGYGKQETGGYSISVEECSMLENTVYVSRTLIGPARKKEIKQIESYPFIVLKIKQTDKEVSFA